jgi:hypothetical protein
MKRLIAVGFSGLLAAAYVSFASPANAAPCTGKDPQGCQNCVSQVMRQYPTDPSAIARICNGGPFGQPCQQSGTCG